MEPDSSSPTSPSSEIDETPIIDTAGLEQPDFNEDKFAEEEPSTDSSEVATGTDAPETEPDLAGDLSTTPLPSSSDVVTSTTPSIAPVPGTIVSAPKKKSRKMLLIILIVVVLVIIGLVVYMFAMN